VKSGESFGDLVEVLDGLKPGDRVVLNPAARLRDGSRIQIREK
jgi:multidrug efflux pump subunit AcrA (membrane-fusion protein)